MVAATASPTFADVATTAVAGSNQQLRAWTQLRLQGHITLPGGDVKAMCPFCESANGATLSHLVEDCPAAGRISAGLLHGVGDPSQVNRLTVEMFENPSSTEALNAVLQLSEVWRLAMSDQLRERQRRQTHGSPREQ